MHPMECSSKHERQRDQSLVILADNQYKKKDSKVNKILFVRNNASIKSSLPSNDYFVVNGDIYTTIVFLTEDGTIKSIVKENSFSEEISGEKLSTAAT